jgi:hypothetical protein
MKSFILTTFLFLSFYTLSAQDTTRKVVSVVSSTEIKSGTDLNKMLSGIKITDPKIYDKEGNIVDSLTAIGKVKSFEYTLGWSRNKEGELKRTLFKINPEAQILMDANARKMFSPKSEKLQEGILLDLKPLSKRIDLQELKGKAVLLIFWGNGLYAGSKADAYEEVNEVLEKFKNPEKLQIIAITHHSVDDATRALAKSPIVNTRHILNAEDVNQAYETENRPVIVLTDKMHKIVYSIKNNATMTPRILNNTLKEIL